MSAPAEVNRGSGAVRITRGRALGRITRVVSAMCDREVIGLGEDTTIDRVCRLGLTRGRLDAVLSEAFPGMPVAAWSTLGELADRAVAHVAASTQGDQQLDQRLQSRKAGGMSRSRDETSRLAREAIAGHLSDDHGEEDDWSLVPESATLRGDLELDPSGVAEIVLRLERAFGTQIPARAAHAWEKVWDVVDYLLSKQQKGSTT